MVPGPGNLAAPREFFTRMASPLARRLSNIGVGKKLLLIYLLDLSTVIFISSILIREKYITIDFSRKELAGIAYIEALRPTLIGLGRSAPQPALGSAVTETLTEAERRHGTEMASTELNQRLQTTLQAIGPAAAPREATLRRQQALEQGRELVTRIGNQSNLILDPDLDSYYTMSIVLLRLAELQDVLALDAYKAVELKQASPAQQNRLQT